jgi:hypothetical protein
MDPELEVSDLTPELDKITKKGSNLILFPVKRYLKLVYTGSKKCDLLQKAI